MVISIHLCDAIYAIHLSTFVQRHRLCLINKILLFDQPFANWRIAHLWFIPYIWFAYSDFSQSIRNLWSCEGTNRKLSIRKHPRQNQREFNVKINVCFTTDASFSVFRENRISEHLVARRYRRCTWCGSVYTVGNSRPFSRSARKLETIGTWAQHREP